MRARHAVPTALLLALVAGLGWLVLADSAAPARRESAPAPPSGPDRAPPEERADRTRGRSQMSAPQSKPPDGGFADVTDDPPLDGRVVRVVDGATGEALPEAELAFLAVAAGEELLRFEDLGEAAVARVFAEGRQLVVGRDGRARIGTVPHRALVAARSNGNEGLAWSQATREDELEVRVYRRTSLTVRVVDATGGAVGGIGVVLAERSEWDDLTRARGRTDPTTGEATLLALRPAAADEKLVVSVAAPFAPQPEFVVDLRQPPQEVIELRLPPAGAVVCEIVDERGAPTGDDESVALRRRPGPEFGDVEDDLVFRLDEHIHERATVANGVARFPSVGLGLAGTGLQLEARLAPRGGNRVTTHVKFTGPTGAGQEVRVRLLLGPPRPVLIGRVLTPEGEPVADLDLVGQVLARGESARFFRHDMYTRTARRRRVTPPSAPTPLSSRCRLRSPGRAARRASTRPPSRRTRPATPP